MDKVERKEINLMGVLPIEVYRLSDGEFRVTMASASVALGYRYDWLSQAVRRAGTTLKRLEDKGFTGCQFVEVSIGRATKSGASTAKTISIDDFDKLLEWAE